MNTDYSLDRGLPASPEAERSILGAILLDNELADEAFAALKTDHFFLDAHRRIYARIGDLAETSRPIDPVTLTEELQKKKELKAVGGVAYLSTLTDGVPRRASLKHYIDIVVEKATLRNMIHAANGIIAAALDSQAKADEVVSNAEAAILNVAAEDEGEAVKIGEVTADIEKRVAEGIERDNNRTALQLTWGLSGLDSFTKGAFEGEFTIISGESSGGKTAFAVQMTLENALEGVPCAWMSIEMPKEKIKQRYYPAMSEILTAEMLRDPRLMNYDVHVPEVARVKQELGNLPILIDDTSPIQIDKLISRIRMMRRKFGVRLFIVDYLQLIEGLRGSSGQDSFKQIVFALRDLPKKEQSIHLVVLSQYSKADGFTKKRERGKDSLYGGSVIHHAAQNVIMISVSDPEKSDERDNLDVEIKIAKQREGKRGRINCFFDRKHLRFTYASQPIG